MFEDNIRKNRTLMINWIKYAGWEESQKEIQRSGFRLKLIKIYIRLIAKQVIPIYIYHSRLLIPDEI